MITRWFAVALILEQAQIVNGLLRVLLSFRINHSSGVRAREVGRIATMRIAPMLSSDEVHVEHLGLILIVDSR